jgi:hypothetical protein
MNRTKHLFFILLFLIQSVVLYSQIPNLGCCNIENSPEDEGYTKIEETQYSVVNSPGDDGSFPKNSDGLPMGFTFSFLGRTYESLFININGNVTFGSSYGTYQTVDIKDLNIPMIAPYWSDIDLGDDFSLGAIYYKYERTGADTTCIKILWYNVGYYPEKGDKRATFQLTLTNGRDDHLPEGNNVGFCYDKVEFTTGSASCVQGTSYSCVTNCYPGGGFGGTPATVGITIGDGKNIYQVGRFDHKGIEEGTHTYEPTGNCTNFSGTDWLVKNCNLNYDFSSTVILKAGNCENGTYNINISLFTESLLPSGSVEIFYDNRSLGVVQLKVTEPFNETFRNFDADGEVHTIKFVAYETSQLLKELEIKAPEACGPKIINVTATCTGNLHVCANIVDSKNLAAKQLYYRISGTGSVFSPVELALSPGSTDYYCATIPSPEEEVNVEYYLYAENNDSLQGWYGTHNIPNVISCGNGTSELTGPVTQLGLSIAQPGNCTLLQPGDILIAYYKDNNGVLREGGRGIAGLNPGFIMFAVHADDPDTPRKDGFAIDEEIVIKLIRAGVEYEFIAEDYVRGTLPAFNSAFIQAQASLSMREAEFEVRGNGNLVASGSTTVSVSNNTDFGTCSTGTKRTFQIRNTSRVNIEITSITTNNGVNFEITPSGSVVIPAGGTYNFDITYKGSVNAIGEIRIHSNASQLYTFTVSAQSQEGSGTVPFPLCDGVEIYPIDNSPGIKMIKVTLESSVLLEMYITDASGNYLYPIFFGGTYMGAGTHNLQLQNIPSLNLQPGTQYHLVVKKGDELCSIPFVMEN